MKNPINISLWLTLLCLLKSSTVTSLPFKRPINNALVTAISRGGTAPIEPIKAAKATGILHLAHGAYLALAPETSMEKMYGVKEEKVDNPTNAKIIKRIGICCINVGLQVCSIVFGDVGLKASVATSSLLWFVDSIISLVNKDSETTGPRKAVDFAFLAVSGATAAAALCDSKFKCFENMFKATSLFYGLVGLVLELPGKKYGFKTLDVQGEDEHTAGIMSVLGMNNVVVSTLLSSLAWGLDPMKAIGYTSAVAAVMAMKASYFTPELDGLQMDQSILAFWPIWHTGIASTILLHKQTENIV